MRYNKPWSGFCLFQQKWQMESRNGKDMHYLLKMILPWKKTKQNQSSSFCCIIHARIAFQIDKHTDDEQRNTSWSATNNTAKQFSGLIYEVRHQTNCLSGITVHQWLVYSLVRPEGLHCVAVAYEALNSVAQVSFLGTMWQRSVVNVQADGGID